MKAPHPFGVVVLAQGGDAQPLQCRLVAAEDPPALLEHPLAEERPDLVEEDDVDPAAGGEVGEIGREARLEAPTVDFGAFAQEDRHVEVAGGARRAAGMGAEDPVYPDRSAFASLPPRRARDDSRPAA